MRSPARPKPDTSYIVRSTVWGVTANRTFSLEQMLEEFDPDEIEQLCAGMTLERVELVGACARRSEYRLLYGAHQLRLEV